MLNNLTDAVGYIAALSIAAERSTEILKNSLIPAIEKWFGTISDERKSLIYHLLSGVAGAIMHYYNPDAFKIFGMQNSWQVACFVGLLTSGGSGFWHTTLSYISSIRDAKVVEAETAKKE